MRTLFYCIFCLFGFSVAALAQTAPANTPQSKAKWDPPRTTGQALPPAFQKQWILMDCKAGETSMRFSSYFALVTTKKSSRLSRLQNTQRDPSGYYQIPPLGEIYRFFIGQNGDLIQLFTPTHKSISPDVIEKKTAFIPHIYYKDCQGAPPAYLKEDQKLVDLMPQLDTIHQECPDTNSVKSIPCQTALMALFDHDNDLALNEIEARAAWESISPYSNIRNNCSRIEQTPLEELLDFDRYYKWLLAQLDGNHNKLMELTEITQQWEVMRADPLMNTFINVLETAQAPLGLLPATNVASSTNVCAGKAPGL